MVRGKYMKTTALPNLFHNKKNHIKDSIGQRIFRVFLAIILILACAAFLFPYLHVLAKALNSSADTALGGLTIYPRKFTFEFISIVLQDSGILLGLRNTVAITVIGSLFTVTINYVAAYALWQKTFWGKTVIVWFLTIPMFISGGIVSNYVIYSKIGMIDNFLVYILPGSFNFFTVVFIRTYLTGVSTTYVEAARIDGASELKIAVKIILPLSMPIIAVMLLRAAVGYWNSWSTTLYYIDSPSLYTLPYYLQLSLKNSQEVERVLREAIEQGRIVGDMSIGSPSESIQAAQTIISTLPLVCLYPFFQKYLAKGVSLGGIKE